MSLDAVRTAFEPFVRRLLHIYWRFARGMTLGVRALVIDEQRGVFLVKHSYVRGWHLPGGGVEADETLLDALIRELREEANIEPTAPPRLHGMFFNNRVSRRDHVAVYVLREFRELGRAGAQRRDHRARFLQARPIAQRHHGQYPRPHLRGYGRRPGAGELVTARGAAMLSLHRDPSGLASQGDG